MIIRSKNFELKLGEIPKDGIPSNNFNDTENDVFKLIHHWNSGKDQFEFHTSGSTGAPKKVLIPRWKIEYSVQATFDFIDPRGAMKTSLLCLDPTFIGGAMVVLRAIIKDMDLYLLEPTSSPLAHLPEGFEVDLVSLVPMQYSNIPRKQLARFKTILIGGAPIKQTAKVTGSTIYSTYGMTETVSHVGLRKLEDSAFHLVGDATVALTSDQKLKFKGTITDNKWLITNDLGSLNSDHSFTWSGRADFVINSGGVKLHPEVIEQKLSAAIDTAFLITSAPDERLGQQVVLVIEGTDSMHTELDFTSLTNYEKPKQVVYMNELARTPTGKLDRIKTRKLLLASNEF